MYHFGFILHQLFGNVAETFVSIAGMAFAIHVEMKIAITLDDALVKRTFIAPDLIQHAFLRRARHLLRERVVIESDRNGRNLGMVQCAILREPMHAIFAVQKIKNCFLVYFIPLFYRLFKNGAVKVAVRHDDDLLVYFFRVRCHECGH